MVHLYRLTVFAVLLLASAAASALLPLVPKYQGPDGFVGTAAELVARQQALEQPRGCGYGSGTTTYQISAKNQTEQSVELWYTGVCSDSTVGTSNARYFTAARSGSSCPSNSTLSGGSCACNTGFIEINGACEPRNQDKDACWNLSVTGTLPGGDLAREYRYIGLIPHGKQFCIPTDGMSSPSKGCIVTFERDAFLDYGGTSKVSEGRLSMSPDSNIVDQSCNLSPGGMPPPQPPQEKCKNGFSGTVNGVDTCVTKKPNNGVGDEGKETEENDGTETKKTKTESRTECKDGKCTTTTTTTTTITNNSTGASTTTVNNVTTTTTQNGFCKENPQSKLCKEGDEDGSEFGGSCAGGFTCEGDAIQCAIAKEQHVRACKLFDDKDSAEYKLYEAEKGKTGKVTDALEGNREVDVSAVVNANDQFIGGGSCPADPVIQLHNGATLTIPYSTICPYLRMLGNVLVILASISAVFIVIRRI